MHVGLIKVGYFNTGVVKVHIMILCFFYFRNTIFLEGLLRRGMDVKILKSKQVIVFRLKYIIFRVLGNVLSKLYCNFLFKR